MWAGQWRRWWVRRCRVLGSWLGNVEACGVVRLFGRHLGVAIWLIIVSALWHVSGMLEVERKRHVYIETERLKNLMIEKEWSRTGNWMKSSHLIWLSMGYLISPRSPSIRYRILTPTITLCFVLQASRGSIIVKLKKCWEVSNTGMTFYEVP